MAQATQQKASKEYKCGRCKKLIFKGQIYSKRYEGAKVHGITKYYPLIWHYNANECIK